MTRKTKPIAMLRETTIGPSMTELSNLYTDLSKKKVVKELDSDTRKNLKKLRARIGRILNDKK